jgi:hypothetical protein
MSATYPRGAQEDTTAGKVILVITSSLATVLLIAAVIYAIGTGQRHMAALAAAGCEPSLSPSGQPCTTAQTLKSEYMAILAPATQQLNADMAAYTATEGTSLAGAEAALTAEVALERAFDTSLAGITFPPAIAPIAKAAFQADVARANLTAQQAQSSSLIRMRSFNQRVQAASAAVQTELALLRKALDAPPAAG